MQTPAPNEAARQPNIDPASFALLNEVDGFLARAPLTRDEHAKVGALMQSLVRKLDSDSSTISSLKAALEAATVKDSSPVVGQ